MMDEVVLAEAYKTAMFEEFEGERDLLSALYKAKCDAVTFRRQQGKVAQARDAWESARWEWLNILYPSQNRAFSNGEIDAVFDNTIEAWEFPPLEREHGINHEH